MNGEARKPLSSSGSERSLIFFFFFCIVDSVNSPSTHSFRLCVPGPITIQEIQNTYMSLLFHIAIRCSLEKERTIEKENV